MLLLLRLILKLTKAESTTVLEGVLKISYSATVEKQLKITAQELNFWVKTHTHN